MSAISRLVHVVSVAGVICVVGIVTVVTVVGMVDVFGIIFGLVVERIQSWFHPTKRRRLRRLHVVLVLLVLLVLQSSQINHLAAGMVKEHRLVSLLATGSA
jgi:hypothetical protein